MLIVSHGAIFVKKASLVGLFSGERIFGGSFAFQNGLDLTIKTTQNIKKRDINSYPKQPMGLYSGGLIIGRIIATEIWGAYFLDGLVFGRTCYRNFTIC